MEDMEDLRKESAVFVGHGGGMGNQPRDAGCGDTYAVPPKVRELEAQNLYFSLFCECAMIH